MYRTLRTDRSTDRRGVGSRAGIERRITELGRTNITLETIENIARALEIDPTDLFRFPLSDSEEANELNVLVSDVIQEGDADKIRKMVLFVREILG